MKEFVDAKGFEVKVKERNAKVPDYSVGTLRVGNIRFAAQVSPAGENVPGTEPSGRKIDHTVSNLPNATIRGPKLSLAEVIERAKRGELGSTEVPANQVW